MGILDWFKGNPEKKTAAKYQPAVDKVNVLAATMKSLSDEQLAQKALQHRGKTMEQLTEHIPEIFAAAREASERALKMRHFDVQLMGALSLLDRKISEMKTGEGKTLVATLPLIVHALTGKGAHLVTVNDYLAQRDAGWMKPLYDFFGLSIGVVVPGMDAASKRAAYHADITYGTNNEFGFDYLRDNMAQSPAEMVQRELNYAIVDEVDSILIDEARTPLIISMPDMESPRLYQEFSRLVPQLKENTHYNIDEKRKAVSLTDEGISLVEKLLNVENIYEEKGIRFVHHLEQALRAHALYRRDKDYVVQEGQVIIVDEFTGRLLAGRRYSEGLHQAIEAKEGVQVQQESRTLATITFQNFFRLYKQLAGMTGTAATSSEEFEKVYNLEVAVIPTNKPMIRNDRADKIFINEKAKFSAVVEEIEDRHKKKQPVLVGTIAIEKSEYLSALLHNAGVPHQVLNAKHHAKEAEIISNAGQAGTVTISTNMAGRGTDIKLGEGVVRLGGLFVLGTERHEARRIDNQLRGRSGRQGDPGESQFFVSMEDDVMRVFGGSGMRSLMERLRMPEDEAIENRLVSKALEGAQERVEGHYFDMRKQVLSYDDVLNRQRNAIYALRRGILQENVWRESNTPPRPLAEKIQHLLTEQAAGMAEAHTTSDDVKNWNFEEIAEILHAMLGIETAQLHTQLRGILSSENTDLDDMRSAVKAAIEKIMSEALKNRQQTLGAETFEQLIKAVALRTIDLYWMDHLDAMDYVRTGIGLRGYGQRDPLVEYQREGHRLYQQLMATIKNSMVETIFKAQAVARPQMTGEAHHASALEPHRISADVTRAAQPAPTPTASTTPARSAPQVGRNDPCPCGSGKKYKKCHGK